MDREQLHPSFCFLLFKLTRAISSYFCYFGSLPLSILSSSSLGPKGRCDLCSPLLFLSQALMASFKSLIHFLCHACPSLSVFNTSLSQPLVVLYNHQRRLSALQFVTEMECCLLSTTQYIGNLLTSLLKLYPIHSTLKSQD